MKTSVLFVLFVTFFAAAGNSVLGQSATVSPDTIALPGTLTQADELFLFKNNTSCANCPFQNECKAKSENTASESFSFIGTNICALNLAESRLKKSIMVARIH